MSGYLINGLLLASAAVWGADRQPKEVKEVPVKLVRSIDGPKLYRSYCAVCHGVDGRGDGPAADALKKIPTDLTLITKRNNGKFSPIGVRESILGNGKIKEHGTVDMPMWGSVFNESGHNKALADMQFVALVKYIEQIQR